MNESGRDGRLLARLRSSGRVSVAELADGLGVTESTIRRDLRRLEEDGSVLRTYGGATLASGHRPASGDQQDAAKQQIADLASTLVVDDQTIAVGSGSTVAAFALRLVDRRLTVITNALNVANILVDQPGIELIILGGVVRPRMHSMLGHLTELAAQELRADTLFMGIGAISVEQGLMNDSVPEIVTDRALRRMARVVVVLADSSKIGHVAPGFVFGLSEVDVLVTDSRVKASTVERLQSAGVRVLIAPSGDEHE